MLGATIFIRLRGNRLFSSAMRNSGKNKTGYRNYLTSGESGNAQIKKTRLGFGGSHPWQELLYIEADLFLLLLNSNV